MATEYPPLGKSYVVSYANNDRDFPIIGIRKDPRVDNYKIPEDLSPHPDSVRYPNHVFTGANPTNSDERVLWTYEILPAPWVPFTRYDDDLGPIQGRRRSVKNEGQQASLTASTKISYEGRDGSAIVLNQNEETWSIATDDDGNSLFPIKIRDFYDPSRGAVEESRQLIVPTGEEVGSLENINGTIVQSGYEPYNEYLSVKIVQKYKVDGPLLIGNATDNDGQLVQVTTQRKGSDGYVPPSTTATRTVEASSEDAESVVERIIDTPEVFGGNILSTERPDPVPQKFRVAVPIKSSQNNEAGTAAEPTLTDGEISKSEEQRNKFIKRISSTFRNLFSLPITLEQKATNNERQVVTVTETLQKGNITESPSATTTIESEALGDGNYVVTKTEVDKVFGAEVYRKSKDDLTPQKFRAAQQESTIEQNIEGTASDKIILSIGEFSKSEQQVNNFVKRVSTTSRDTTENNQLLERVLTPEGLNATRTLTLASEAQTFTPSALLIDANVESLGDGRTVKTEVTIPDIFTAKTLSVEKPDSVPVKFRALVPSKTEQHNEIGSVADSVDLASGEIAKSESQQTKFVKRIATTKRDQSQLPVSLTQKSTDNDKQIVTIIQTLQNSDTIEQPSATVTIESENLGGNNFVVTKSSVPELFSAKSYRKTKEDLTPQKFKAKQEDTTKEENIIGTANQSIVLGIDEFSKTEQQLNKFVKRVTTVSRKTEEASSLSESILTQDGQLGTKIITLASGDQTFSPRALLIDANVESLGDGRTIKTETTIPEVFDSSIFSIEKPDNIPLKFKASIPLNTTQKNEIGTASDNLDLQSNEISKSEQQVNKFVKRTSVTSRDAASLPKTLEQTSTNNQGQVVTIIETLQSGNTADKPSATVTIESEAIDDTTYVVKKSTIDRVFDGKTYRVVKTDNTPPKFRAKQIEQITEETVEGKAALPLVEGEIKTFEKSEQQITEFVKRISTTTRSANDENNSLSEKVLTPQGQLGRREITIQDSEQEIQRDALLIEGNVESLGDGRTVKTEVRVDTVFNEKVKTLRQPIQIPNKFVVSQETTTETIESTDGEPDPLGTDGSGIVESSAQRITEHKTRKTKTEIEKTQSLTGNVFTKELGGGVATVTESITDTPEIDPSFGSISLETEPIGGGSFIKREVKLEDPQELMGQEYDDVFDVVIKFKEKFVNSQEDNSNEKGATLIPRDNLHSQKRTIELSEAKEEYLAINYTIDDVVNISLPDVLQSVKITGAKSESETENKDVLSTGNTSTAGGSAEVDIDVAVNYIIRSGYSGLATATKHVFFIDKDNFESILQKTESQAWPTYRPQPANFFITVFSTRESGTVSVSLPNNISKNKQKQTKQDITAYSIPPTLHSEINLEVDGDEFANSYVTLTAKGTNVSSTIQLDARADVTISGDIEATNYPNVTTGKYLYSVNTQNARYGLIRVEAIVVEITESMVN